MYVWEIEHNLSLVSYCLSARLLIVTRHAFEGNFNNYITFPFVVIYCFGFIFLTPVTSKIHLINFNNCCELNKK